jgi:plasmid replication initiation protein
VREAENREVYLTFSPRFEHIWLESKKRLLASAARTPPHTGLRSRYAIRLYAWAQEHRLAGSKRITLERLRTVLGLDSVKDPKGKVIRKAPLPVWVNLRQRALDLAIAQINQKTDLNITLESLERAAHRRVTALTFSIKARTIQNQPSGQTQKTMNGRLR